MRAPAAKKTELPHNQFSAWRAAMRVNQDQAGILLGKKKRTIQDYERKQNPAQPSYTDRIVMAMLLARLELPPPWPSDAEIEMRNRRTRELHI